MTDATAAPDWDRLPLLPMDESAAFQLRWEADHLTAFVVVSDGTPAASNGLTLTLDGSSYDFGRDGEGDVDEHADEHDVRDGPEARALTQRDPEHEHDDAGQDHDDAQRQAGGAGDALVQHVPREQPEPGAHQERDARAEECEAQHELHETTRVVDMSSI